MLETIGFALGGLLMDILGQKSVALTETVSLVAWQKAELFSISTEPDPEVEAFLEKYLNSLSAKGYNREIQGVAIESQGAKLAQHNETVPASAASLTKIATTIAALETWDLNHRFETKIYKKGKISQGVLEGDLILEGNGDPVFVWEEAIAVGNLLNEMGIRQVKGDLIVTGNFLMNFKSDRLASGELFKSGIDRRRWSSVVEKQYQSLRVKTSRPQVAIAGKVRVASSLPVDARLLLRHQSLKLTEILRQMNLHSNNAIAETLGEAVGGATIVAQIATKTANVPAQEIRLINTSGLGVDNRISPRAASRMMKALVRRLESKSITIADLFPVGGRDRDGTMQWRAIPSGVTVKTGTLSEVSALAGVIPTEERGLVWFAIVNRGSNIEQLRGEQDRFLEQLSRHWQIIPAKSANTGIYWGDPSRNLKAEEKS
jgi:D-alanyl-D-alanine carboxypeptidase/D-alanyl-D-alanine-endopeptidase (penicillin-binding protein 4)